MRKTEFCVKSPTQTAPAAKAIAAGCTPTRIVFATRRCAASTRDTVPLPEFADHREPAPYASPVGCAPTWIPGGASASEQRSEQAHRRIIGSPLAVLERGLRSLRVVERERAAAHLRVQLVLDRVDPRRPRVRLGPEIPRVGRVPAELEADQVILLVAGQRAGQRRTRAAASRFSAFVYVGRRPDRARPARARRSSSRSSPA